MTQRDKRSDRSAGISFSSDVNPILSSFQKGLVAKIMDAKRVAGDLLHNRALITRWPNNIKFGMG